MSFQPSTTKPTCHCLDSLKTLPSLVAQFGNSSEKCHGKVYLTDWATKQCSYSEALDLKQPKIPVLGLVTVPGSGNTWTRSLVQRLTAVLSGSVYARKEVFNRGLYGELEPWNSKRTSFIKNHLFQFNEATKS